VVWGIEHILIVVSQWAMGAWGSRSNQQGYDDNIITKGATTAEQCSGKNQPFDSPA